MNKKNISIEKQWSDCELENIKIIGIGGGNGKTTIAKMTKDLLVQNGFQVGLISHYEISIGNEIIDNTPLFVDKNKFFGYLEEMLIRDVEIVIIEFDFFYFDYRIIDLLELDSVLYTSIDLKYQAMLGNLESYILLQKRILNRLHSSGIVIINADDKNSIRILEGKKECLVVTYGLSSKATITASSINLSPLLEFYCCIQRGITTRKKVEIEPMEFPICMNFLGKCNVYNALGAITVSLIYGVSYDKMTDYCNALKGPKRRLELVYNQEFKVIDDIGHNPICYDSVFETIQSINYKNLHIIIGINSNGDVQLNSYNAYSFCSGLRMLNYYNLITTCSIDFMSNGKSKFLESQKAAFHNILFKNSIRFEHKDYLNEAIQVIINLIKKGDLLLLLGEEEMQEGSELIKIKLKKHIARK